MRARGYGLPGRTNYSLFRFSVRDGVLLALILVLFAWSGWAAFNGYLDFSFSPAGSGMGVSAASLAAYGAVLAVMLIPFLSEVKERMVWSYFRSKI
jgi:energy-coupling factor transport system permease protein